MSNRACAICGNETDNAHHTVLEMQLGLLDPFEYFECGKCKTWQNMEVPEDLSKYYPENYLFFRTPKVTFKIRVKHWTQMPVLSLLLRTRSAAVRKSMLRILRGTPREISELAALGRLGTGTKILDVGCGSGSMLVLLYRLGFRNLRGIDKFIQKDITYAGRIQVRRADMAEIDETFDLVTSHHSFEHMPDPRNALYQLRRLTRPGGTLMIRTPNADCWSRREYGLHWSGLDAPRHLFVYTPASIRLLAEELGLIIDSIYYDSHVMHYIASVQYRNGIATDSAESFHNSLELSMFSNEDIENLKARTQELNEANDGDAMCVIMTRPEE